MAPQNQEWQSKEREWGQEKALSMALVGQAPHHLDWWQAEQLQDTELEVPQWERHIETTEPRVLFAVR